MLAVERPDLRVLVVDPGDMRTEMHQDAFPGEDINDRPEPETRVPALLALVEGGHAERPLRGECLGGGGIERVMSTSVSTPTHAAVPSLGFVLDPEHEAHQPPEVAGGRRDHVRLLVSDGDAAPVHTRFDALGEFLRAGDLVVVNTSATVPAAVDARMPDGDPVVVHFSGELPGGALLVEVRQPAEGTTVPRVVDGAAALDLLGLGRVQLHAPFADSRRLWLATATFDEDASLLDFLDAHGRPIRYRHVPREWPIEAYQTVFAREPGSVEMPSAARPFSTELVTDLVGRGIGVAPLLLHTGVSSLEGEERPYPERYRVPRATAPRSTRRARMEDA